MQALGLSEPVGQSLTIQSAPRPAPPSAPRVAYSAFRCLGLSFGVDACAWIGAGVPVASATTIASVMVARVIMTSVSCWPDGWKL